MGDRCIRAVMPSGRRPYEKRRVWHTAAALALAMTVASPAAAQSSNTALSGLLPELILREIRLPAPTAQGLSHAAHFSPFTEGDVENPAVAIVAGFNQLLIAQLSTFPLGSSAGGFSYAFDPSLGTFRRASNSFGPAFAERAATVGRRRFSAGFNYQHTRYSRFEGRPLDDGSIRFYLRHQECCTAGGPPVPPFFGVIPEPNGTRLNPFFEGDVIEAALSLNATTQALVVFANYGIADRWDAGLAVPIVRVELEAHVLATIHRLATAANPAIHSFEAGNPAATQRSVSRTGTASGLGDIVLRTKYRFVDLPAGGLAASLDMRVPTGDEDNLLGGSSQLKLLLVASGGTRRFVHHVNVGYTFSGDDGPRSGLGAAIASGPLPDEFNYTAGTELVLQPRVTLVGDLVGRVLRSAGRLALASKTFEFMPAGASTPSAIHFDEFEPRSGSPNLLFATGGIKFNPRGNLLLSANVLFPLTDAGLKGRITTVVGMDYAF